MKINSKSAPMDALTRDQLKQKFQQPLPGLPSQLKMAPPNRATELRQQKDKNVTPRHSAVLMLLFEEEGALKTVFIKRSEYNGLHSGQISFPGGKFEAYDSCFEQTALRETREEIGVCEDHIELIGQLTELYIPPSNFLVKVFVGYCQQKPMYTIEKREVERVIEVALNELYNPKSTQLVEHISSSSGLKMEVPAYVVNNVVIWGATAMMVSELLEVLTYRG